MKQEIPSGITTILTVYKRPMEYLKEQILALNKQTIRSEDVWIWYNKPEEQTGHYDLTSLGAKVIYSSHNFKFHGRFALGLLAKTKYIAVFDDDTVPGIKWFENCINTIENGYDGILGTTGVVLDSDTGYVPNHKFGWNGNRVNEVKEVDLVGHAWFMKKEHLRHLWKQEPVTWETGEDMQLSYFAQKHSGVKTFVPPHPEDDISLWGSHPEKGIEYGTDIHGESMTTHNSGISLKQRNKCVTDMISGGWKLVKDK